MIRLAEHPAACPDLGRHAVYLGTPGQAPHCPPGLHGKTESAWITRASPASPDSRLATRAIRAGGQAARVNPDPAVTHTITVILPGPAAEVSLSWGRDPAVARRIQASIRVAGASRDDARRTGPAALTRPLGMPAVAPVQSLYQGGGFDTCGAPAASAMTGWLASPYRAIGIYIGGLNRGCAQPNLTSSWITAIQQQGWHYFPFYVGRQATCVRGQSGNVSITPKNAAAQGKAAADDAATQARALGIPPRTPVIYDMEAYSGCPKQVLTFLGAWDKELPAQGYEAAVYESFSNVGDLVGASASITEPSLIHYADWDSQATTQSSYMPATMWLTHQRIHQFRGGHDESWGGVTLDIDSDQVDALLGGSSTPPPAVRTAFRPAVGLDGGTAPDVFARAANRTLVHDVRSASGSWSGVVPLGASPADIASNPAVTANANGQLTVTARTTANKLVYAWQNPAASGGWAWGGTVPAAGHPGALTGSPAAARRPDGKAEFFATGPGGAVLITHQTAVNGNQSWSAWKNIGGSCASTPVPFTTPAGHLELFCRTRAGTAALTQWTGQVWTAWQTAGASPTDLTAAPAVVATAGGQAELLAATTAGELDLAWQDKNGTWHWVTPVVAGTVRQTPAAIRWPDGKVRVYAKLGNGTLGVISQAGTTPTARWSGWALAPGGMLGSPAVWAGAAGVPGAAVLATSRAMATASFRNAKWTALTPLGGQF